MSDPLPDFNLILLPDWLKEPADKNPYADYQGEPQSRGRRGDRFDRGGERPRRGGPGGRPPGRGDGPRDARGGGPERRRDDRGPRPGQRPNGPNAPGGPNAPKGQGQGPRRDGQRPQRPGQGRDQNRDHRDNHGPRRERESQGPVAAAPQQPAVPLQVDFIPECEGIAALTQQIKGAPKACPLYSLARMFLNKPERHRVRITTQAPACPIYRLGEDGPISLNRAHLEREAFRTLRGSYYSEETQEIEAPKGNFSNVARCRISGVLLGPTNHHGYQPALRRLYDTRFSRRSSYDQFLRQIEVVNDPAVIEQWKTECSSVTVFRTLKEETPVEFKTLAEVEAHFRAHYLETAVQSHLTVEVGGVASRNINDRALRDAIRAAWEKERGFPAQLANQLRPHFVEAGLQIWKHRKRVLFVSTVRPSRFAADAAGVSGNVAAILGTVEAQPRCTRADLSAKLIPASEDEAEAQKAKAALAADLHWLISSGHVIEFHDGTLDLPLPPKEAVKPEVPAKEAAAAEVPAAQAPAAEESAETESPAEAAPVAEASETEAVEAVETVEAIETAEAPAENSEPEAVAEAPVNEAPVDAAPPETPSPEADSAAGKESPQP